MYAQPNVHKPPFRLSPNMQSEEMELVEDGDVEGRASTKGLMASPPKSDNCHFKGAVWKHLFLSNVPFSEFPRKED